MVNLGILISEKLLVGFAKLFIEGELLSGVVGVGWLFLLVVTA
jgi:hypothetical protein